MGQEYDLLADETPDAVSDGSVAATAPQGTILDRLRESLMEVVTLPPLTLKVIERPGMSVRFDTNIANATIQGWRKQSRNKSMPDEFDSLKFSSLVIANKAIAVMLDGQDVTDEQGDTVNFTSPELLKMLGVNRALDAVRKLYGVDGHIIQQADAILSAAGYDEVEQKADDDDDDPSLAS